MSVPIPTHGRRIRAVQSGSNEFSIDLPDFEGYSVKQQSSDWCWAACIEMVTAYQGHRISQVEVVNALRRRSPSNLNGSAFVTDLVQELDTPMFHPSLSTCPSTWLIHDLLFDSPILLALRPTKEGEPGHIVVLTGVDYFVWTVPIIDRLTIYDPLDGLKHDLIGPEEIKRFHQRLHFAVHLSAFEYRVDFISQLSDHKPYGYQDAYVEMLDRLDASRVGRRVNLNRNRLATMY